MSRFLTRTAKGALTHEALVHLGTSHPQYLQIRVTNRR